MVHVPRPDRRSLYIQVRDHLRCLIEEGRLQPGDALPPEPDLARQLGVSRSTLRRALGLLEEAGLIVRRQGLGTFVSARQRLEGGLEQLGDIVSRAVKEGAGTQVRDLVVERLTVDAGTAERLGMERGASLVGVERTIVLGERPIAYLEDRVLAEYVDVSEVGQSPGWSLSESMHGQCRREVQGALAEFTAVHAGPDLARRLALRPGAALVLIKETVFDLEGRAVGHSRGHFLPAAFRFRVKRS